MSRLVWLSSTTSTCTPFNASLGSAAGVTERATDRRRSTTNVDPAPGTLSTRMLPPISASSRLQIASPSPVPPY
jgi:hypothetical protein